MIWKRYRNELLLLAALLMATGAFFYKHTQHTAKAEINQQMAKEIALLQETVSLKSIWADRQIPKKLAGVRSLVPASKVTWQQKGKRLYATFHDLSPFEVNRVITRLLNIAVQVEQLEVKKEGEHYTMEIKCKW
ncbi:MAG: hypothetical protein L3J47_01895 [Sulfurovum sp.]|nr:hypothetical protein [Sulfurovum sp.]